MRGSINYGDHIYVIKENGNVCLHGIYVSDDEVIYYTGEWIKPESAYYPIMAKLASVSLVEFVGDGEYTIVENKTINYSNVVEKARELISKNKMFLSWQEFIEECSQNNIYKNEMYFEIS